MRENITGTDLENHHNKEKDIKTEGHNKEKKMKDNQRYKVGEETRR